MLYFLGSVFFILMFNNPMFLCMTLVSFSLIFCYYLLLHSIISGLMGMVMLMIYLGAMMILFGYVCAVTPNLGFSLNSSFSWLIPSLLLLMFTSIVWLSTTPLHEFMMKPITVSSFLYGSEGFILFMFILIVLLFILFMSSAVVRVSAPFRSI